MPQLLANVVSIGWSLLLVGTPDGAAGQRRQHVCYHTDQPVVIDGRLDDSAWADAAWTDRFVDIEGDAKPRPQYHTRLKMLWDDRHLYLAASLEDPHVWGTLTKRDAIVFQDNDFEIFIDPDGDAREYFEIEVNALNTIFDLLLMRTYKDGGPARHEWDVKGLQSAVHVDGTLNDPSDTDGGWNAELAIPWRSLAKWAHRPAPPADGDVWRMNFSRVQWQHRVVDGRYEKVPDTAENNWVWSPQGEINMHLPLRWGYVKFATASSAGGPVRLAQHAPPAPTADPEKPSATLRYSIQDETGRPMPGRLTFLGPGGPTADLFPNTQAAPDGLAVRKNIIYTLSGQGAVTVPPDRYTIYASRGPEWSIHSQQVNLKAGGEAEFSARLRREVDTSGWVCADFHLHTLTYSGHGDSNLKERIITFLGEGLEFAVATDHNHNTDYQPTMQALGVEADLTAVTGNEVTVPIGHFNAFPLDPKRPVPPKDSRDATTLFKLIRAEPNRYGIVPVIQVNHPRWGRIAYFGNGELDPVTGVAHADLHSYDFDSIEVFNENEGWGYYDAERTREPATGAARHCVLRDWFNMLNRGRRPAAVGNSDSHTVHNTLAAYPRNYLPSSTDDPGRIDVAEVAAAVKGQRLFTSIGPFVEYWVDDRPMGADVKAADGSVELRIKIQAASWVDCDRVKIVINGDVVRELPVPDTRQVERLDTTVEVAVPRDCWLTLLVEGDDSLAPIVHDQGRPVRPLAVTNPVWIDADGDGRWASPWEQAQSLLAAHGDELPINVLADLRPSERGLVVFAAAEGKHPAAGKLIRGGLADDARVVRLLAARAAETLGDSALATDLIRYCRAESDDPYAAVSMLRAVAACAPDGYEALAFEFADRHGADTLARYSREVFGRLAFNVVRDWMAVGYFPNPEPKALVTIGYGPETEGGCQAAAFDGKGDGPIAWQARQADESGYLDLGTLHGGSGLGQNAIAYARTWLFAPDDRTVRFALGTDDGCRLWINDVLIHEDNTRHGADPYRYVGRMQLKSGWNRVLVKVENGVGDFGLYFRIFDQAVRAAADGGATGSTGRGVD
ncbi:MAG: CehA/McbA family metallohydrolase [bacterium]|nr:CehA/McbA family metallohydrolase [bacterium]